MKSRILKRFRIMVGREAGVFLSLCAALLSVGLLAGCSTEAPPPPPPPPVQEPAKPEAVEHTIQYKGETLGLISKWYTGNPANWNLIIQANPGLKPNRMNLGDVIKIPGEIVTRREPLPKSVIPKYSSSEGTEAKSDTSVPKPPTDSVSEGDSPAKVEDTQTPPKPVAQDPTVDQLLEELADSAKSNPTKQEPPVPAAVPPAPPAPPPADVAPPPSAPAQKAPAQAGDAEREQLLDELLGQ